MKILIVGSSAVIDKAVAAHLVAQGQEVRLAGRREADFPFDLTAWRDQSAPDETFDVVVNVAADFGGSTDDDYIRTELVNSVETLPACCLAHRVQSRHFVLLSSISANYRAGDHYYGIYSPTKRHSEEVAQFFCDERGIALAILRPSQVYDDAGESRHHQALFYLLADQAQAGNDILIFGSHDAKRNYIHLSDLTEVISRGVQGRHVGLFACMHQKNIRISDLVSAAYSAFKTKGQVRFDANKPDLPDLAGIDDYLLYRRIDFWRAIDIYEGYRRIKQYRENSS